MRRALGSGLHRKAICGAGVSVQGLKRAGPVIVVRGEGRRAPGISAKFGADSARGKWIASNGLRSRVLGIWLLEGESVGAAGQWVVGAGVVHGAAGSRHGNAEQRRGVPARGGRKEGRRGRWRVGPGGQTQSGVNGRAAERERAGALADEWGRPVGRARARGRANAGWSGSTRELGLTAS